MNLFSKTGLRGITLESTKVISNMIKNNRKKEEEK